MQGIWGKSTLQPTVADQIPGDFLLTFKLLVLKNE